MDTELCLCVRGKSFALALRPFQLRLTLSIRCVVSRLAPMPYDHYEILVLDDLANDGLNLWVRGLFGGAINLESKIVLVNDC